MVEFFILKGKVIDFREDGQCEVNSLEHAELMLKILSQETTGFNMEYRVCPMGEYWLFTKI